MASKIILYDSLGNPVEFDGDALKNGLATAWVNFDGDGTVGADCLINGSFGVSRVNKIASGEFKVFFLTAMSNTGYVFSGVARNINNGVPRNEPVSLSQANDQIMNELDGFRFYVAYANHIAEGRVNTKNTQVIVFGGKD